jgi:hypothetical protein
MMRRSLRDSLPRRALQLASSGLLAGLASAQPTLIQSADGADAPQSREQAALVEEQDLLARKLTRIVSSMNRLADRYDAEGRVHAAKLLRDGLTHIAERHQETDGLTLSERMSGSHDNLRAGQSMQSIETQVQIVLEIESLMAILMDRPDLDELESEIEKLQRQKLELQSLASAEAQLQQETEDLIDSASNKEQKELEAGLAEALRSQRELLSENERLSRQSGALDLERIEEELATLLRDQTTDAEVLHDWDPAGTAPIEELIPYLDSARKNEARAARLENASESLRSAGEQSDPAETARSLSEEAESARRDARASGDQTAARTAEALERAAESMRQAGDDEDSQRAAATEVAALAEQLEAQARAAKDEAAADRSAARAGMKSLETSSSERIAELTRELAAELEEAELSGSDEATKAATEKANRELRGAVEQNKFLSQALGNSQKQNARRAEQLKQGIERLPQDLGEQGTQAQQALEEARDAMNSASRSAQQEEPAASQEAADRATEALERAQAALQEGRSSNAREMESASSQASAELAGAQEELAAEVEQMRELADQASLNEQAKSEVKEALETASEAMKQASSSMQQGKNASAAQSQRQAAESLQQAAREAREGVEPQTEGDRAKAEELAKEQQRIEKELYEFRQKYEQERAEDSPALESLSSAQRSASQAQQSLEQGNLDQAQKQEQQAEQEIEQAMAELEKKEEQYQQLRDEELLFQIAEEVTSILTAHEAASTETLEVDRGRKPGERATRGQKLRLRKISRGEDALAKRSSEIRQAISAEGSLVFAELIERIEHDLGLVARSLGPEGNYQSGDRVQALQADVSHYLGWLQKALEEEQDRREEEQNQAQSPGSEAPQPEGDNKLVPDVAELKLLSRMEVDVLDSIEELLVLYPELKDGKEIDPLLLEEIQRLAHRHERSTELFQQFREQLGISAPTLEQIGDDSNEDETQE